MVVLGYIAWAVCMPPAHLKLHVAVDTDETAVQRLSSSLAGFPAGRAPGSTGHQESRTWLTAQLERLGLEVRVHEEWWEGSSGGLVVSLEAILPAAETGADLVLVSAHYDTVPDSMGADDNGSGCVVLLELAKRLAQDPPDGEVRLIWFDGEERGLLGSQRYAAALTPMERSRIRAVINLECVGYVSWDQGSQRLPPGVQAVFDPGDVGDFILLVSNIDSRGVLQRVAASFRLVWSGPTRVESFGWIPGRGWALPDTRRSDHAPFWDLSLPAVLVTDTANFRNPNYHRPSDQAHTLDLEFLAAVARGVEQAVRELTTR